MERCRSDRNWPRAPQDCLGDRGLATGPQVAWKMARGGEGAFGGRRYHKPPHLARVLRDLPARARRSPASVQRPDPRRPRYRSRSRFRSGSSTRATSSRACRSPIRRCSTSSGGWAGSAWRGGPGHFRRPVVLLIWLLAAATEFLAGFRIGLYVRDSNVIDVGYSGVRSAPTALSTASPRTGIC